MNKQSVNNSERANHHPCVYRLFLFLIAGALLMLPARTSRLQEKKKQSTPSENENTSYQDLDTEELNNRLREKIRRLQKRKDRYHELLRQKEQQIQKERTKHASLQSDLNELEAQLEKRRTKHNQLQNEIEKLQDRKNTLTNVASQLSSTAETLRKQLREHIQKTIPYRVSDRTERLQTRTEVTTKTKPVRAINQFWDVARREINDSRSAEVYTRRISLPDGRKKHARIVRVGQNLQFFVTEDEKETGLAVRNDGSWSWEVATGADRVKLFQRAMNMIQNEARPTRLLLPVPLLQNES